MLSIYLEFRHPVNVAIYFIKFEVKYRYSFRILYFVLNLLGGIPFYFIISNLKNSTISCLNEIYFCTSI